MQGGQLHIQAKVKHAPRGAAFHARAVVHFNSGDVTVNLRQRGHAFVAQGTVAVASNETPGVVPVSVTVDLNNDEQEVETNATVEDDPSDNGDDDSSCDPATTTCDDGDANDGNDDDATCDPATTTCDDGDANDGNDDDATCDPATTTCDDGDANDQGDDSTCDPATTTCDDGDSNDQGGGDQGDDNGGDSGDGSGGD